MQKQKRFEVISPQKNPMKLNLIRKRLGFYNLVRKSKFE